MEPNHILVQLSYISSKAELDVQYRSSHCVQSVRILSFSSPYLPAFGLNTERYLVSLHIQSKSERNTDLKNSEYEHFSHSVYSTVTLYTSCLENCQTIKDLRSQEIRKYSENLKISGMKTQYPSRIKQTHLWFSTILFDSLALPQILCLVLQILKLAYFNSLIQYNFFLLFHFCLSLDLK